MHSFVQLYNTLLFWKAKQVQSSNLYCTTFPDEGRINFVFQIVNLLGKIPLWGPGFDIEFLAERNPLSCKLRSFRKGFKSKHGSTVIRNIAWNLIYRIINSKYRQDGVCCDERRLLHWIHRTDVNVNGSQLRWLAIFFISANINKMKLRYGRKRGREMEDGVKGDIRSTVMITGQGKFLEQLGTISGTDPISMMQQTISHRWLMLTTIHMPHGQGEGYDSEKRGKEWQFEVQLSFCMDLSCLRRSAAFSTVVASLHPSYENNINNWHKLKKNFEISEPKYMYIWHWAFK